MNTKTILKTTLFSVLAFFQIIIPSHGQSQLQEGRDNILSEKIATLIETRLQQPGGDTASFYIIEAVRKECGKDGKCLRNHYYTTMETLRKHAKYRAALPLAEELQRLAQSSGDVQAEVAALKELDNLYGWNGQIRKLMGAREKMVKLYEQMGNMDGAIYNKALLLEGKAWKFNKHGEAIKNLEALVNQAIELNLTSTANNIRTRLKHIYEAFNLFDELEGVVSELEKIPYSEPLKKSEVSFAFHALSGRADLLLRKKQFDIADSLYQKALHITRTHHVNPYKAWNEVYLINRLVRLEIQRQNYDRAESWLNEAFIKSTEFSMDDHLLENEKLKAELAEAQHHYADALYHTKKYYEYQAKEDSTGAAWDVEKYFMEMEAEQLELEKERQTLALLLKTSQLNYSILIVTLVILLAAGLLFGLYKQRKGKQQIAVQYALIQQQSEQLKLLDAAKSRFFANVSHELRTPLTLMLGPVKTLLKDKAPPEQRIALLNMALQSGQQLHYLVNEILDLRKLEMGKMELNLQPTDLRSFFIRYASQFESLAASGGIDFSFETSLENGVTALLDREKCRQVLHNLLSNAFKFTPAGGSVTAKICLDDNILTLEVADTGPGIHPDDLPHVFDRFYQTSRPDATAQGGTGIGLALCHEYLQLFGGKMKVESRLGEGSTFRAVFPVTLTETQVEVTEVIETTPVSQAATRHNGVALSMPASAAHLAPPKGRASILVVEDNPDLQQYIRLILEEKYHVITADNGKEALEKLTANSQQPIADLILSDLMMPVMDGYQLLEKLKGDDATRHIPVIMLTARAETKDKLKALRIGVDDYLTKPFDEEELLVRIENLLTNQAVRKEAAGEAQSEAEAPGMSQPDQEWLENFEAYIQENLSNDALTISFLAQEFAMSDSTMFRQVTRLTGLSPKQYLQEVRLDAARQLVEARAYRTVNQVSAAAGFSNTRTFTRNFKERFGKSPGEYLNV